MTIVTERDQDRRLPGIIGMMIRARINSYRNTSICLLAAAAALSTGACSSDNSTDPNPGIVASQAGTGQSQAGSTGTANATGGSTAQGGSGVGVGAGGTPAAMTGGNGSTATPTAGSSSGGAMAAGGSTNGGAMGSAGTSANGGAMGAMGGDGSGGAGVDPTTLDKFSFFVTSLKAMRQLSGSEDGFGGDLRYGEADGLTGADKICTEIAEMSMPGSGAKEWHAFLSTVAGPVHARDRIGEGPWYDRVGRLVANGLDDLLQDRPANADPIIKNDLPNEDGVPNKRPDPNLPEDDTHHFLTGSNNMGMLYTQEPRATCEDWTSSSTNNSTNGDGVGRPRIGFSFIAGNRTNWMSGQTEGGCGAGVTGIGMVNGGSDPNNPIVGSGGGYGGIYCFAMIP